MMIEYDISGLSPGDFLGYHTPKAPNGHYVVCIQDNKLIIEPKTTLTSIVAMIRRWQQRLSIKERTSL